MLSETRKRSADDRVLREPFDDDLTVVSLLDHDVVAKIDPLQKGCDLVFSVVASRADDEAEIDLRRRPAVHARFRASSTNSCGSSSSARTLGARSIAASAFSTRPRAASPARATEFASVFRR